MTIRHGLLVFIALVAPLPAAVAQGTPNWGVVGAPATPPPPAEPPSGGTNAPNSRSRLAPTAPSPAGGAASKMPNSFGSPNAATSMGTRPGTNATGVATAAVAPGGKGLFDLPDATPITVSGKATSAGELKRRILDMIATKAGPRRIFKAPGRVTAAAAGAMMQPTPVRSGTIAPGNRLSPAALAGTAPMRIAQPSAGARRIDQVSNGANVAKLFCTDNGPPAITEIDGILTPGGNAQVFGECFGDRAGHVEVIGNFPGGKLEIAFTSWDKTRVDVQVAANVRNTPDGVVAVTIVGADGRRSPAMQARFVATRETVEVPSRLWTPGAYFAAAATSDGSPTLFNSTAAPNAASAGTLARNLRINPQCALTDMSIDQIAGSVTAIRGFDQGPPNEAATNIDWVGTCIDTTTTTANNYLWDQSSSSKIAKACSVALEPRAWASCPAGMSP